MITDAKYALDLCDRIAAHTDIPTTITRTFLSPATREVHALLTAEMQSLGMTVRTDSIGNLRGLYPAANPTADTPILLLGSHIDTVPNAGRYDGILGVAIPLALIRALAGKKLPYAIELIAFSEEEGVRFKFPFLGSRALTGTLGPAELGRTDANGITVAQAIRNFGLNPETLADALITANTFAFLEVHIEQGPILESLALPLAVVETIVAQSRFELTFTGQANHAGTTPMHLRHDALAAAAVFIVAAETLARNTPDLVATVGIIHARPGATNIIPGAVTCSLDIRHPDDATLDTSAQALLAEARTLAESRGVTLTTRETNAQSSVPLDPTLRAALIAAAEANKLQLHTMNSGAGHDAMILAPHIPAAMLFLRTPAGLSHHPDESVSLEDVEAALKTCLTFLHSLAL
jgi:allantoate deiminase